MSIDYDAKIVEAITQMLQVSQTKHTRRPEDHFIQPRTLYIRFSCMAFSHLPIRDVFVCGPDKREQWSTKCLVGLLSTAVLTHLPSRICVFPMSLRKSLQRGGEGGNGKVKRPSTLSEHSPTVPRIRSRPRQLRAHLSQYPTFGTAHQSQGPLKL